MQSPAYKPQGSGVKKVTGVGGTTYEISVWVMARLAPACGPVVQRADAVFLPQDTTEMSEDLSPNWQIE